MSRALILFILGAILSIGIYAGGFGLTSYSVSPGYVTTVEEFSVCKEIKNTGTLALFVPTKTQEEWAAMYSHPPAGVTAIDSTYPTQCCPSQCPSCTKTCTVAY